MVLHDIVTQYADSAQHMLTVGKLILQVGGFPNNSLSVISCSHIYEALYLEELQTRILCFLNTGYYDWILSEADTLKIHI
jgi:predicted SAM-dependent methyltransferase